VDYVPLARLTTKFVAELAVRVFGWRAFFDLVSNGNFDLVGFSDRLF